MITQHSNQMKLSDYVAGYLAKLGLRHAFVISGGASLHLLHSLDARTDISAVCPHHEQAAAMSADAYSRVTGKIGCAIGTSGPGATNMITGIAGAWFDSVPVIYITGQVATHRMKAETGVRQMGFQETDILPMVEPITKYAVLIKDPNQIAYELEKAAYIAVSGRPGPVLIDIPDDLQRQIIDVDCLPHFTTELRAAVVVPSPTDVEIKRLLELVTQAKRPVLVIGWGIRLAGAIGTLRNLMRDFNVPVLTSWAAKDMIAEDDPLNAGTFGTHGSRAGNFVVQNADLVIAVGARLSTHETGTPMNSWARGAKVVVVDVDDSELRKFSSFGKFIDLPIHADAGAFLSKMEAAVRTWKQPSIDTWRDRIADWKKRYPVRRYGSIAETVDPYGLMQKLACVMPEDEHIFIDTGCSIAWAMQAFPVRLGQRLYHDFNNTAMGWALPAAIGGCFALENKPVTCISGDGSLMMNVQELATIQRHQLPVRLFIVNNEGYSMVQQTQDQWLGGKYVGTSHEGGLAFPDFSILARAFGIPCLTVDREADVSAALKNAYAVSGPIIVDVRVPRTERVTPQSRFGYPIEDSEPFLPRAEFFANMLVAPLPKSQEPIS